MSATAQAEQELITGTVTGVVAKGGDKWQVQVQPDGSNYTKGLWTKDGNLAGQLSMMVGSRQSFMCGHSHWTNNQGQPVTSLWINGVGPEVAMQQQPVQQQMPQQQPVQQQWQQPVQPLPQPPPVAQPQVTAMGPAAGVPTPQQKEDRIMREAATKVAAMLISHLPVEQRTLANVVGLSERLVSYYENGVQWQQADGNPGDPGPQGYQHTDDDIPF